MRYGTTSATERLLMHKLHVGGICGVVVLHLAHSGPLGVPRIGHIRAKRRRTTFWLGTTRVKPWVKARFHVNHPLTIGRFSKKRRSIQPLPRVFRLSPASGSSIQNT